LDFVFNFTSLSYISRHVRLPSVFINLSFMYVGRSNLNENLVPSRAQINLYVLALTSYDMFKLASHTSRVPLHRGAIKMAVQAVPNSVAQRIIIKFLTKEGVIPSEIFTRLQAQFADECLSQPRVFSWAKSF
jgi:hypothetical protein